MSQRKKQIILRMPAGDHRAEIMASLFSSKGSRMLALRVWSIHPPIVPFDLQLVQENDGQWALSKKGHATAVTVTSAAIKAYPSHFLAETYRASGRLWTVAPIDDLPRIIEPLISRAVPAHRTHQENQS